MITKLVLQRVSHEGLIKRVGRALHLWTESVHGGCMDGTVLVIKYSMRKFGETSNQGDLNEV